MNWNFAIVLKEIDHLQYWVCMARFGYWGEGYRGGFCKKLLETSPMSGGASASRLQDGHTTGQE